MPYLTTPSCRENDPEAGYVLLTVIFLAVILIISLAVAAPRMAKAIQRDKELETIHRGEQYKRAIQMYYHKFGHYPVSIDQLMKTNDIRFLRKRYIDPLTGKDDWKPVLFGQAHVRPLGFFGQPLMAVAGLAGNSSMYAPSTSATDANGVPIAGSDSSGNGSGSNSAFGNNSGFGSTPNSGFGGSTPNSGFGSSSPSSGFGSSSPSSGFGSSSQNSGFGGAGASSGLFASSVTDSGSSSSNSATGLSGVGPIVGVTLPVDKPSLIDYKQQTRYNKWEFNYDPMAELQGGMTPASLPTPPPGTPTNGAPGVPTTGVGTSQSNPSGSSDSSQPQ